LQNGSDDPSMTGVIACGQHISRADLSTGSDCTLAPRARASRGRGGAERLNRAQSVLRVAALCFNQFYQLFIALSDADATVSPVAIRKAGCFIAPFLGPLLVPFQGSFPDLRQRNLHILYVLGVMPISGHTDQIATNSQPSC